MERKDNYRKSVKKALQRCSSYTVRESDSSSTGITYTTRFENQKGTLYRKMDIVVNEEQETIRVKMVIEEGIPNYMKKDILKCINDLQTEWLYGRMWISGNGVWQADYMMLLAWQGEKGRAEFEDNVYRMVNLVSSIFMYFVEKGEAVLQELKYGSKENAEKVLNQEELNLNPFERYAE